MLKPKKQEIKRMLIEKQRWEKFENRAYWFKS